MSAKNCARCGKVFNYVAGAPLCSLCKEEDEKDYKRVKEYLYDHHGATITEVSIALDISVKKLKRFLREGRIEIIEGMNLLLECESCGAPIKSGQYCDACAKELADGFKAVTKQPNNHQAAQTDGFKKIAKMRYLNKNNM